MSHSQRSSWASVASQIKRKDSTMFENTKITNPQTPLDADLIENPETLESKPSLGKHGKYKETNEEFREEDKRRENTECECNEANSPTPSLPDNTDSQVRMESVLNVHNLKLLEDSKVREESQEREKGVSIYNGGHLQARLQADQIEDRVTSYGIPNVNEGSILLDDDSELVEKDTVRENTICVYDVGNSETLLACNDNENHENNFGVTNIFVDANVLEQLFRAARSYEDNSEFVYEVNGSRYRDDDRNDLLNETHFAEFEIRELDAAADESDESEDAEVDEVQGEDLQSCTEGRSWLAARRTGAGVLLSSAVLLSEEAWNTVGADGRCAACEAAAVAGHLDTAPHAAALATHPPLPRFELNLVREINGRYHCAICNIVFDAEGAEHTASAAHALNMQAATSRASDLVGGNERCGRPSGRLLRDSSSSDDDVAGGGDAPGGGGETSGEWSAGAAPGRGEAQLCAAAVKDDEMNDENSEYIHVSCGGHSARLAADSWHMMAAAGAGSFYCMACRCGGEQRERRAHRAAPAHLGNVARCAAVEEFPRHVIRKINDRFYHCGHCNSLYLAYEMKHHVETAHATAAAAAGPGARSRGPALRAEDNQHHILVNDRNVCDESDVINIDNSVSSDSNIVESEGSAGERRARLGWQPAPLPNAVELHQFGQTFRVSFLALHFVRWRGAAWLCQLCAADCPSPAPHILHPAHAALFATAGDAYLPHTAFHLIRMTPHGFHCLPCNALLQTAPELHTWEPAHLALLKAILCPAPLLPPPVPFDGPFGSHLFYRHNMPSPQYVNREQVNLMGKDGEGSKLSRDNDRQIKVKERKEIKNKKRGNVKNTGDCQISKENKLEMSICKDGAEKETVTGIDSYKENKVQLKVKHEKPKGDASEPRDAYDTEPRDAYDTEPRDAYDTEPRDAYDTEPRDAYDTEPRDAYDTEPRDAYDTEPRDAYDTEPRDAYDREPRDAYDTEPRDAYDTEPRDAYDTEPRDAYDTEPRDAYDTEPRDAYDTEPRDAYDTEPRDAYDTDADASSDKEEVGTDNGRRDDVAAAAAAGQRGYDPEGSVLVVMKGVSRLVSQAGYHGVVRGGAGASGERCALCGVALPGGARAHVAGPEHASNLERNTFLEDFESDLLRRSPLEPPGGYHCALCNVTFPWWLLREHVAWPQHRAAAARAGPAALACDAGAGDTGADSDAAGFSVAAVVVVVGAGRARGRGRAPARTRRK